VDGEPFVPVSPDDREARGGSINLWSWLVYAR
jgi:hypothetical protein